MSLTAREPDQARNRLVALYAPVFPYLEQVDALLRRELASEHACVDELAQHAFHLGGKRLRPALLLLVAQACGEVLPAHMVLAAVVEMIHTATLVHDDVLDEATVRRHEPTVNARWNNASSVLLGDYLFTHAFYLASTLDTTFACRTIGKSTNIVCEGELRQINSRGNFELTEAEYLGLIDAKTAELCACCCLLGAHYAGASPAQAAACERYGRALGVAFQIADDLLDVLGEEQATGKSLGTDLEQQKPTLPVIRLLSQLEGKQRAKALTLLRQPSGNHGELREWLEQTDAVSYAREKAASFARQAAAELSHLPASPAVERLRELATFVVRRDT